MADETVTDADPTADSSSPEAEADVEVDELRQGLLDTLTDALGDAIVASHIAPGHALWVRVGRDAWVEAAEAAKGRLGCTFFDFLSAIDWLPSPWGRYEDATVDTGVPQSDPSADLSTGVTGGDTRFQMLCRVANVREHHAVILKADLPDDDLRIASLVPVWAGANWHERECWEMFGITFDGHPGLRHLYLPGGFEGHPLRKDFPLLARLVKPWPGIVDVEPMPAGPAEGNGAGAGEGEPASEGEGAGDTGEGGEA
jgi:NADH-quinone oxidoreductase subunit C